MHVYKKGAAFFLAVAVEVRAWVSRYGHEVGRRSACKVYVHDPGPRYNSEAMQNPTHRWSDLDHNWHVAYWLHQGLLRYQGRTTDISQADVIFVAHYFLTKNLKSDPLFFGGPVNNWHVPLRHGPASLFGNATAVLQRFEERPSDFVIAPILKACGHVRSARWLNGARWIMTEMHFGECLYRDGFDIVAPQVVSSAEWAPRAATDPLEPTRHFLTYVGRLGKVYIQAPMSRLRFDMWSTLRSHPNVTFLATDAAECVAPYLPPTGRKARCEACSYRCKQCIELPGPPLECVPPAEAPCPQPCRRRCSGRGTLARVGSKAAYRDLLANSTFCLVLRGDNENSRKFTETLLSGCIPVLIADMPAWAFERRLEYKRFSIEFDWRLASADPAAIVDRLLAIPRVRITRMRRRLRECGQSAFLLPCRRVA